MNQLCKKFIPLDIACKKAFMGSLTYEEFITLPLFIQQHRSLHKNLLCQHPKKVSFLLFPNRMTTNTTTTDHHHFEILSNNDDMKNYCLNYALVSAFYQNNKYLSNSWHGFHNLMSLKGVFPHTQKLVSDLAKSIDPRLLFNSSFRKFFVELAEVLANIRSTFQNEKELLSYFSMASSSSVNVEYAKCWFFSMPVLMQTSTSSSLKHIQQYSQYLDEDDKKNEFLCTWMIRHHKMYDIIQMSGQNQSRVVLRRWISHNPTLFSSLPKWIQHDKLVALEAVKENPDLIYPILNTELKQDVSIMSVMLKYTPFSKFLQMARSVDGIRDKVVSNKDLLIEVFSKGHESNYGLLEFAPPNIKNDKRMIMACLERFYTKYQSL
ncbi:hypothetical protein C9374_007265 [Naegleria lovaniensis]|uniref:Uncharacterized protein n=1 Tax=Naegleria lovaniensis TaxID=51637 RepID=A0AA88GZZ6_NAELO|nr:uncharacterized protein C9374_007265 [Naegleria lovaniensis]KAG2393734.1 hypothetical protein C9374_007265 [Naegleria lovaniensis]